MKMQECPEFARAAHEVQHPLRLGDAEVVGGLVEDDQVAVEMHRARDRHRLALAARERRDRRVGRDLLLDADLAQEAARHRVHRLHVEPAEQARPLHRLAPEEEVARDRELRHQRAVLVDRLDAVADGVGGAVDRRLLAADVDLAAGDRHRAGQHLDQRRLAGAVVAEEPDDLALAHHEGHVLERPHPPIVLGDVLHADQVGHGFRSPRCAAARARSAAPSCRG